MSVRAISNQHCETCAQDTMHVYCVCRVCNTIKRTPTEQRNAKRAHVNARHKKAFGWWEHEQFKSMKRAKLMWQARQDDVARGRLEVKASVKRPRCINSERRPVKP